MEGQDEETFEQYCLAKIKQAEASSYLKELDLLDSQGNIKKDAVQEAWKSWRGENKSKLWAEIGIAALRGVPYEYLGNMEKAMQYYWLGTYYYLHPTPMHATAKPPLHIDERFAYAEPQLTAAICNDRIGNRGRARQLFEWAAAHLTVTEDEKDQFRREGYPNMVWEYTTDRAFCLLCLERWEEALSAAEEAERWVKMDTGRYEKFGRQYTPFHLLPVYLALARFKAHPSPEREKEARKRFMLSEYKVRVNHLRHGALLYIFELWSRNAELLRQ